MKQTMKVINRIYTKKDGKKFQKTFAKGKYIPVATCEDDVDYTIKFVGEVKQPQSEGVFEVAFESGDCWLDQRIEYQDKNIVRVRARKIVFSKYLETSK